MTSEVAAHAFVEKLGVISSSFTAFENSLDRFMKENYVVFVCSSSNRNPKNCFALRVGVLEMQQATSQTNENSRNPKKLVPLRGSDSLFLGVAYRCPSSPQEDEQFLTRPLGQLSSSYHFTHLLLVGDFNAPKAPWTELRCVGSSGPFAAALTEVAQQSAWTKHITAHTRYLAGQQPCLLDSVIIDERHFVDQVIINAPLGHTDHCVLTFDFICYWARNPEPQTWIRNFCRADFRECTPFLNKLNWDQPQWENLYGTIV
ncbi:hypothetical protein CLF_102052 [Clonorchis sinensis]|uniref:Endonuclease/exonuclease/phosphatase domain-containing protein n=1 Tax=Clonorchis sinensis TaxID=79923 RepID=G7Y765_CLOSI|nr:hypothetical protein CLF_102052 [Clonorchis sinensis]